MLTILKPIPDQRTAPGALSGAAGGIWLRREEAIMGTSISAELWCEDRAHGVAAIEAVMEEMHRIDRAMSPHKDDSELSRINRDAGANEYVMKPFTDDVLHEKLLLLGLTQE